MERRDFVGYVAGIALGAVAGLDIDRIVALIAPEPEHIGTRRIGYADVEALEEVIAGYARSNVTHGGGVSRHAAVMQLQATVRLLDAQMDSAVRDRLHIAAAHLALVAAWMSYDVARHDAARKLLTAGLHIARAIDHPLGTDLVSHLLFSMAGQSLHVRRPEEAHRLVQLGYTAAVGKHPLSPSTLTCLAGNAACAYAARGQSDACARALDEEEDAFTRIDPATAAPWACVGGVVGLTAGQGHVWYELARTTGDSRAVQRAVEQLSASPAHERPVARALYLPELAGARALAGDVDTAVAIGHQAVDAVTRLTTQRGRDRLRDLHTVLAPVHASPGVAELRERLATAAG